MSDIKRRLKSLLEIRRDSESAGIIIGTSSGYMAFSLAQGEQFPEFTSEREAREALTAAGIKKIVMLTERTTDE